MAPIFDLQNESFMDQLFLLDRLILAGGPPRSGTTLIAKLLNSNPNIVTAIDNNVYESWGLYHYQSRTGLIQLLRTGEMSSQQVKEYLLRYIVKNNEVWGIANSDKVASYPKVSFPKRPSAISSDGVRIEAKRNFLERVGNVPKRLSNRIISRKKRPMRHRLPVDVFRDRFYLCLKSPEIVFVLVRLAKTLPQAKFVLVYRPVIEIAESMYRKGFEWKLPSYHKRWSQELNEKGEMVAPPGVPQEWHELWKTVSDFQRCVIYATSYLRAMVKEIPEIPSRRVFVYDHTNLRKNPSEVLLLLSEFLGFSYDGFANSIGRIRDDEPIIINDLLAEYNEIDSMIGTHIYMEQIANLENH